MKISLKQMPMRLRILLAAAILVIGGGLLAKINLASLPIPGTIGRAEGEVQKLRQELASVRKNEQGQQLRIAKLRDQASVFWQTAGNPHAEIAGELDKAARRANITLLNTGSPGESKISERLSGTEISIQFLGSMHEIARFLAALESNRPRFYWRTLNLSPDNPRDPKKVTLSGRLMLITLSQDISKLLEPKAGTP